MPLFLAALPLSFQTFWRYLILLPFLMIAATLLSLASIVPIFGFLVPGIVSAFCTISGVRCALAARGHRNPWEAGHLFRLSLIFAVVNVIVISVISFCGRYIAPFTGRMLAPLAETVGGNPVTWSFASSLLIPVLLTSAYSAAIAVPMVAATADNRRGATSGVLDGFGTGLFSLLLVSAVWLYLGNVLSIFGEGGLVLLMMLSAIMSLINGEEIRWSLTSGPGVFLVRMLLITWASSWLFATAVIGWELWSTRQRTGRKVLPPQKSGNHPVIPVGSHTSTATDLRALRLARQNGQRG